MEPTIPTEPKGGDRNGANFPSITRAEQAAKTQETVQSWADMSDWQPPAEANLPKADTSSGLAVGTPLASRESLTPGQLERVEALKTHEPQSGSGHEKMIMPGDTPYGLTDKLSSVDRAAREGRIPTVNPDLGHMSSDYYGKLEDEAGRPVYHYGNGGRSGSSTPNTGYFHGRPELTELSAAAHKKAEDPAALHNLPMQVRSAASRIDKGEPAADLVRMKESRRRITTESRAVAVDLFNRNPEKYSAMATTEFVAFLAEYSQRAGELSKIEATIADQEALLNDIEDIEGKGKGADTLTVLTALRSLTHLPHMPQDQTLHDYIASIKDGATRKITEAKQRADQLNAELNQEYGTTESLNGKQHPDAEEPSPVVQPDDHMANDTPNIVRGEN